MIYIYSDSSFNIEKDRTSPIITDRADNDMNIVDENNN